MVRHVGDRPGDYQKDGRLAIAALSRALCGGEHRPHGNGDSQNRLAGQMLGKHRSRKEIVMQYQCFTNDLINVDIVGVAGSIPAAPTMISRV